LKIVLTDDVREALIRKAIEARDNAYAPYSNYAVGAALVTTSGRIFEGVNVENAAYPDSICAERVAVFKAVSEGERRFEAIAVVTANGGMPCGSCRQVLAEFGLETRVLIADDQGHLLREVELASLLPESFGPQHLSNQKT
jgi:cytidine deaminase